MARGMAGKMKAESVMFLRMMVISSDILSFLVLLRMGFLLCGWCMRTMTTFLVAAVRGVRSEMDETGQTVERAMMFVMMFGRARFIESR